MKIRQFLTEDGGTTTVEYAVMLMLIVGLCIAAIQAIGGESGILWGNSTTELDGALNTDP